jgi:enamine deaminase RidA (YjgF/YER057c/UK114 family)
MKFMRTSPDFPFSAAVIHSGRMLETVLTGIPPGKQTPVPGGPAAELREIFHQLDEILALAGVDKTAVVSVRLYVQSVVRDISELNGVYKEYFGVHPPNRRAYGVDLQSGMLVEAAFVAELSWVFKVFLTPESACIFVLAGANGAGKSSIAGPDRSRDNREEADASAGLVPQPKLIHVGGGKVMNRCELTDVSGWAKPIVMQAMKLSELGYV